MLKAPDGTLTFILTDIEGSTRMWEEHPIAMALAIPRHEQIITEIAAAFGGFHKVEQGEGDSTLSVFSEATKAAEAACLIRDRLAQELWPEGVHIRVRTGIHSGIADMRQQTYYGRVVNRTARVRSLAHGGQILMTRATRELLDPRVFPTVKDHGLHRLKDLLHPEHLFELPSETPFPPLASLTYRPNNLPVQLTSFVGRASAQEELLELVRANRMVTVAGPGGCGKTRLALQVGAELIDELDHGVWFVDLAPLQTTAQVLTEIVETMRLEAKEETDPLAIVTNALRDCKTLLVLDNCEQIRDGLAGPVQRILKSCPGVRLLATSRQRVGVPGETTYRLPTMEVPSGAMALKELGAVESVALFCERATSRVTSFLLTDSNADAVREICVRLEGIPLAIEQAACNVAYLSPRDISSRLDEKFKLLKLDHDADPRQQTLEATIGWSYSMLDEAERALFERLSVFPGGFPLDAAEAVCAGGPIEEADVLPLLQRLIDKSLVISLVDERLPTRYRMLETIRDFASSRMGDAKPVMERLLAYHVDLSDQIEREFDGPQQTAWLVRLEVDHSSLRAALEWSRDHRRPELTRLALGLARFWLRRGYLSEGTEWLESSLEIAAATKDASVGKICNALGTFEWMQGNSERAQDWYLKSVEDYNRLGDEVGASTALMNLGILASDHGDLESALTFYERALQTYRIPEDDRRRLLVLINIGMVELQRPNPERAMAAFTEALALAESIGDNARIAVAKLNIADTHALAGEVGKAVTYLGEAALLWRETTDPCSIADGALLASSLFARIGDHVEAAKLLFAAKAVLRSVNASPTARESALIDQLESDFADLLPTPEFTRSAQAGGALSSPALAELLCSLPSRFPRNASPSEIV